MAESERESQKYGSSPLGRRLRKMELSGMEKPLWEGTRSSQTISSGPDTSSQHHLSLTGINGASAEAQNGYYHDSIADAGLQEVQGKASTGGKILLIICRSQKNKTQAPSLRTTSVNCQLHPKIKPLVAEERHGRVG